MEKKNILILFFVALLGFSLGYLISNSSTADSDLTLLQVEILKRDSTIDEFESQLEVMQDEIIDMEDEISYWGHKYDSLTLKK